MSAFKKESLALKYIEDVAKSHRDAALVAFCAGYSQVDRENTELRKLLKELRQRLNKGFLRLDEWQISDMVKLIDAALKAAERDGEWRL